MCNSIREVCTYNLLRCDTDEEFCFLISHFARVIQEPWVKQHMCLGVSGEQQSGKTLIFVVLGKILGSRHFVHLHSMKDMFGEFSTCVCNRVYVFPDECIWAGSHQDRNELKNRITADT